jgi:hypothetical protein
MAKNNVLLGLFMMVVGVFGLRVMMAQMTLAKPPVPIAGMAYTVDDLLDLINMNNPNKTSNFIVPLKGKSPNYSIMTAADCSRNITDISGSRSVSFAGLKSIVVANMKMKVSLRRDDKLVGLLYAQNRLDRTTKEAYAKILLYFELGGYRFYLVDPFPGKIVAGRVNIARNIINKWNFSKAYIVQ